MKVLDTNQIKQAAWDKLGSKWTNAVITLIIFTVIPMIISYPASSFENHSLNQNLWKIFDAAISSVLCIGVSAFFYDLVRNRNLDYKRLFVAFTRGWTFYLSALCVQILIPILVLLWSLLLIVPGIMKCFSYAMANYVLLDHPDYSPLEAIRESKEIMYGHRMELFVLVLRFIPWFLLVPFTLGIALIWVAPYFLAALSEFYLQLKKLQGQTL